MLLRLFPEIFSLKVSDGYFPPLGQALFRQAIKNQEGKNEKDVTFFIKNAFISKHYSLKVFTVQNKPERQFNFLFRYSRNFFIYSIFK